MHRPQRHRRKAWRTAKPTTPGFRPPWSVGLRDADKPTATLSRREKYWLGALAITALVAFFVLAHFTAIWSSKRHLDDFLGRLQINYNLDEAQIAAIRRIEQEYHGQGGIFSPSRSYQEKRDHDIAISQQMSPADGARFLVELQTKKTSLTKKRH